MERFMKWWEGILMSNKKSFMMLVIVTSLAIVIGINLNDWIS